MVKILYWARLEYAKRRLVERFAQHPDIRLQVATSLDEILPAVADADGILVYDAPPDDARRLVDALAAPTSKVRWMHILSTGREGFDSVALPSHVEVTSTPGTSAPVVAEHAMALLLALVRRIPHALRQQDRRLWDRKPMAAAGSLESSKLLIVGYGAIGQEVARRAKAFGARVSAVSRSSRNDPLVGDVMPLSGLHGALADADMVVVAIALGSETRHLLDRAAFASCKRRAIVVNVSRGAVIDQAALIEALQNGMLAGAGLDVTDPEPLPVDDPLWACPNVLITPHCAGAGSPASEERVVWGVLHHLGRVIGNP